MKKILIVLIIIAGAAVGTAAINLAPAPPPEKSVVVVDATLQTKASAIDNEAECLAEGGRWTWVQSFFQSCVLPYPDAGETCTSSAECEGGCVVQDFPALDSGQGTCRADTDFGGCSAYVEDSVIECLFDDIKVTCDRGSLESDCQRLHFPETQ